LRFFGHHATCYVCEAEYKDIKIVDPEPKFSFETEEESKRSIFADDWQTRVKAYLAAQKPSRE
jgi:hypothetical protein